MPNFPCSSLSCLQNPVFGWQQGRFSWSNLRHLSKLHPYFCMRQAMRSVEHLEIPAAQCTRTFLLFLASSIHSKAGRKVCVASWVWQSLRLNLRWMKSYGYVKCRSTPEQTAEILFLRSSYMLWAKSQPLIQISPSSPSRQRTRCPLLQQGPNENIFKLQLGVLA